MPAMILACFCALTIEGIATWLLYRWGRRISLRHPEPIWPLLKWLSVGGLVVSVVGSVVVVVLLVNGFSALSEVSADERSMMLARSLIGPTKVGVIMVLSAGSMYLISVFGCVAGTIRTPKGQSHAVLP